MSLPAVVIFSGTTTNASIPPRCIHTPVPEIHIRSTSTRSLLQITSSPSTRVQVLLRLRSKLHSDIVYCRTLPHLPEGKTNLIRSSDLHHILSVIPFHWVISHKRINVGVNAFSLQSTYTTSNNVVRLRCPFAACLTKNHASTTTLTRNVHRRTPFFLRFENQPNKLPHEFLGVAVHLYRFSAVVQIVRVQCVAKTDRT